MTYAATTSPFAASSADAPWILWQQKTNVNILTDPIQTDRRSDYETKSAENASVSEAGSASAAPQVMVQRNQYNAVLSRMNQATHKTGSFSAWKS